MERETYASVLRMLADGFTTRRGRRGALIHRDEINGVLRGRRGARLTAITSGGTIPDNSDFQVLLEPENVVVGTVNEDFAVESIQGDIFQLGNTAYRIMRVERGTVRVEDAQGQPPTIPFWLGEAPSRSEELSQSVSRFRTELERRFEDRSNDALEWISSDLGLDRAASEQIVDYLGAAYRALGALPTRETLIFERFFDEAGGMQLVIHSPYGSRINKAWGLALRKRFCRKFNFELQAAATEDNIVLSLTTAHSFDLAEVARYLNSKTVREILIQALLDAPMFGTRWRWVAGVALALPRFRGGKKVPPQLMRMMAEDLVGTIFPDQVACAENLVGEREVPDHPLVAQTISDCLNEAMDIEGLERLLAEIESGAIRIVARDLTEPSPLAREVLTARPYAYLDDAPLEERRTQAVMSRRWLDPNSADEIGRLDAAAVTRVREEAWPDAANADELHDALVWLGFVTEAEADARENWKDWLLALAQSRRAALLTAQEGVFWVPAERLRQFEAVYPGAVVEPAIAPPASADQAWEPDAALVELVRGRLEGQGPLTLAAACRHIRPSARADFRRAHRARSGRLCSRRLLHAGRERARMVRAAAACAHPSLYGEAAARRDRARLRARLSPLPVRLAGRLSRCAARRREGARCGGRADSRASRRRQLHGRARFCPRGFRTMSRACSTMPALRGASPGRGSGRLRRSRNRTAGAPSR